MTSALRTSSSREAEWGGIGGTRKQWHPSGPIRLAIPCTIPFLQSHTVLQDVEQRRVNSSIMPDGPSWNKRSMRCSSRSKRSARIIGAIEPMACLGSHGGCAGSELLRETVGCSVDVQSDADDYRQGSVSGGGLFAEDAADFLVADQQIVRATSSRLPVPCSRRGNRTPPERKTTESRRARPYACGAGFGHHNHGHVDVALGRRCQARPRRPRPAVWQSARITVPCAAAGPVGCWRYANASALVEAVEGMYRNVCPKVWVCRLA